MSGVSHQIGWTRIVSAGSAGIFTTTAGTRYIVARTAISANGKAFISAEIVGLGKKIEFCPTTLPANFFRLQRKRRDNVGKPPQNGLYSLDWVKNDGAGPKGQNFAKYFCLMTDFDKLKMISMLYYFRR